MKKISVAPENPQYRIVEIFESLQGEGWNTGMPAVFVRLGKCNLACGWCDTDYLKFGMMSLSDILGRLKTYTARNIIITGGEPTIQPHLDTLLDALKAVGIPTVEVHISDVDTREEFRRVSYVRAACVACIKGHGFAGYCEAIDLLLSLGQPVQGEEPPCV